MYTGGAGRPCPRQPLALPTATANPQPRVQSWSGGLVTFSYVRLPVPLNPYSHLDLVHNLALLFSGVPPGPGPGSGPPPQG